MLAKVRQLPIAQRKNGVVDREYKQIGIGDRLVLRCHQHFAAHRIARLRSRVGEMRHNFQFAIRTSNIDFGVSKAFQRKCVFTSGFYQVNRNRRVGRVIFFDRNFDSARVAFYRNKQGVEYLICLDRYPCNTTEWRLYCECGFFAR